MRQTAFNSAAALVFIGAFLAHGYRAIGRWSVRIEGREVPLWLSWAAMAVSGSLAWAALSLSWR